MYGGGTSGDVPPPVFDGVICVGSIVAAFLRHASASLRDDSLANVAVVSWCRVITQRAQWQTALRRCATAKATAPPQSFAAVARCVLLCLIFSTVQSI